MPFLGTGEARSRPNCRCDRQRVAEVSGVRIRNLPITPTRVRAGLVV